MNPPRSVETAWGWAVVAAAFGLITVSFGGGYLIAVALRPMTEEMDWPRWIPSLATALIWLGGGIGGIVIGRWADRHGIIGPLIVAAFTMALGSWMASRATTPWELLFACAVPIGFFTCGATFAPLVAVTTRWFDRNRGLAIATVTNGQNLAGTIWAPIFGLSVEEFGWRTTWLAFGLFASAVMLPLILVFRRRPPGLPGGGGPGFVDEPPIRLRISPAAAQAVLVIAIIGCCIAMAMPKVHLVAYCADLGFAVQDGAQMLSVLLACAVLSRLAFGILSDRIGGLNTVLIGCVLQAIALAMFSLVSGLTALYLVSALFGLVFGGIVPSYAMAVREIFPAAEAGKRIGVVYLGGYIGMGGGGLLGGVLFDLTASYEIAFAIGVAFNLLNLAALAVIYAARVRPPTAPDARGVSAAGQPAG